MSVCRSVCLLFLFLDVFDNFTACRTATIHTCLITHSVQLMSISKGITILVMFIYHLLDRHAISITKKRNEKIKIKWKNKKKTSFNGKVHRMSQTFMEIFVCILLLQKGYKRRIHTITRHYTIMMLMMMTLLQLLLKVNLYTFMRIPSHLWRALWTYCI